MQENVNKGGRPTDYKPEFAEQARKLSLLGAIDLELADFFGVSEDTIYEWKKVHPKFSEAVAKGKILADAEIADSLYKRGKGYKYEEVTYERIESKDSDSELAGEEDETEDIKTSKFKKKVVVKELPPDTGAAMNWLSNRQRGKWRQKVETGFTNTEGLDVSPIIIQMPHNDRPRPSTDTEAPNGVSNEVPKQ